MAQVVLIIWPLEGTRVPQHRGSDHMSLCKGGKLMSNRSVLKSNTEDVILNRVDASNTEDPGHSLSYPSPG